MAQEIYGIDPDKKFNAKDVRDAIILCFTQAHQKVLDEYRKYNVSGMNEQEIEEMKKMNVEILVKKFFKKIGGDFENPKKEDLIKVCDELAEFAKNFRDQKTVKKNYNQIASLIKKLK